MGDVTALRINFDSVTAERVAITQCANFVRRRTAEMLAAEAWIACGEQLAALKKTLVRKTSRGENERIGWKQAFTLEPREFPFGRRHADKLIEIHKFFLGGHAWPLRKLPASVSALHLLASSGFAPEKIKQAIDDGLISPGSTADEVKALAKKHKLLKSKKRTTPKPTAPKQERIAYVRKILQRLYLTKEDL